MQNKAGAGTASQPASPATAGRLSPAGRAPPTHVTSHVPRHRPLLLDVLVVLPAAAGSHRATTADPPRPLVPAGSVSSLAEACL
jgi:hypothetical protein